MKMSKQQLRCTVQIKINGLTESESASIRDALEPDNINMPKGLAIDIKCNSNSNKKNDQKSTHHALTLKFEGIEDNTNTSKDKARHAMGHLIGTVDEVLEHVQVAQGVLNDA